MRPEVRVQFIRMLCAVTRPRLETTVEVTARIIAGTALAIEGVATFVIPEAAGVLYHPIPVAITTIETAETRLTGDPTTTIETMEVGGREAAEKQCSNPQNPQYRQDFKSHANIRPRPRQIGPSTTTTAGTMNGEVIVSTLPLGSHVDDNSFVITRLTTQERTTTKRMTMMISSHPK